MARNIILDLLAKTTNTNLDSSNGDFVQLDKTQTVSISRMAPAFDFDQGSGAAAQSIFPAPAPTNRQHFIMSVIYDSAEPDVSRYVTVIIDGTENIDVGHIGAFSASSSCTVQTQTANSVNIVVISWEES